MPTVREAPVTGELYHIYNRGVDKRTIFLAKYDLEHFFALLTQANSVIPIGHVNRGPTPANDEKDKLVGILAYHLLGNHFHLILRQKVEGGIAEFMKRLGGGYTSYFNKVHDRSGSLFQGKYKYIHVNTDEYLRYVLAYVMFNDYVHSGNFSFRISEQLLASCTSRSCFESKSKLCQTICECEDLEGLTEVAQLLKEGKGLALEIKQKREMSNLSLE